MIFFSPSLYLTVTTGPSTPVTALLAVPLVMVLLGAPSQGLKPSPVPRICSGKMCTSMAFCEPSGCGIAPLPMKAPSLMSAIDAFTTATTSILSARLSVTASPLSDFAVTVLPSTFSITPRRRTVCGACATAAVAASAATRASAARIAAILMSGLQVGRSHRRRSAVATDIDGRRGQRSVLRFLRGNDDELRARLEIGWAAGFELHHRRVRRNDDLFLAVRIFDHDGLAVDAGNGRLDVGV